MVALNSTDVGEAITKDGSPQQLAYLWLQNDTYSQQPQGGSRSGASLPISDARKLQRYRLMVFYYATNGNTSWIHQGVWGQPSMECNWELNQPGEVYCTDNSVVVELQLINNNVTGTLPPELGEMISLKVLVLDNVPQGSGGGGGGEEEQQGIGSNNTMGLTGGIPSSFHSLVNMEILKITGNTFTKPLPDNMFEYWNRALNINFGRNQIPGPIPTLLSGLINLRQFNLGGNNLTGTIPSQINDITMLNFLILSNNELQGQVPTITSLIQLRQLRLNDNNLTGTMPNVTTLTQLKGMFDLSNNQFTGGLPPGIGNLQQLQVLNLRNTGLTGSLLQTTTTTTNNFDRLTQLRGIDLSENPGLFGTIPPQVCNNLNLFVGNTTTNTTTTNSYVAIVDCINTPCIPTQEVCCSCCECRSSSSEQG